MFGRLKVLEELPERKNGHIVCLCKCICGNTKKVILNDLKSGRTLSCGCLQKEQARKAKKKYDFSDIRQKRLYGVWKDIKQRCFNTKNKNFTYYGGRGITMCEEWKNDFFCFYKWAINNGYEKGLSIDRKDNNGNYNPENCRWVTALQQSNNRRTCLYFTMNGETKTLSEWCREYGVSTSIVRHRMKYGMDFDKALKASPMRNIAITINNETKTIVEWSEFYGIRKRLVWERIRAGWNILDALNTPKTHHKRVININGEVKSLEEWCNLYAIEKNTFYTRIKRGYSEIEAITKPVEYRK